MSTYLAAAYHPQEHVIRTAWFMDDYFGKHQYGVQFDEGGTVFKPADVAIPTGVVFVKAGSEEAMPLARLAKRSAGRSHDP